MTDTTEVLAARIDHLADGMERMEKILGQMSESLSKLAVVEERQATATESIKRLYEKWDSIDSRVRTLEVAEPMQSQVTSWVLNAVWGVVGAAAAFLAARLMGR